MVLKTIKEYDDEELSTERTDFLAFLRQQQKSTGVPMSTRDLMNHLMNNLYVRRPRLMRHLADLVHTAWLEAIQQAFL